MAGGRRARWQLLGVVGQEGQMGQGQWGKEGQMARREGMEGCMKARWQLLGVGGSMGQEFKMVARQRPDQVVRGS